ncbi:MAG: tetratricopeptide repeat protein [Pedosphaera sp.]|nr:tetratricopeptide repeat protein [Pedosphaera sp.]
MAKPVAVTLPFVLLLLDYWPLNRIPAHSLKSSGSTLVRLALEKIPFFVLSLAACVVTLLTARHSGAVVTMAEHPLGARIETALLGYIRYLGKTTWPADLALPYPQPAAWPVMEVLLAAVIGAGLWAAVWWWGKKRPYIWFGWLWFLGTLVPVIGLMRWGDQAMADRFVYLPLVGVLLVFAWGGAEFLTGRGVKGRTQGLVAALILTACGVRTLDQLQYWRNSETLFRHALACTTDNSVALSNLGSALADEGRSTEALPLFLEAVRVGPRDAEAHYNLGTVLMKQGKLDEATERFRKAIALQPAFARALSNLGATELRRGNLAEAGSNFTAVLRLKPDDAEAYFNLATVLIAQNQFAAAITNFSRALALKPDYAQAHANLGVTWMRMGNVGPGTQHLREAARLDPNNSEAHFNLGLALLDQNQPAGAGQSFRRALALQPGAVKILFRLGVASAREKKYGEAIDNFREVLKAAPDSADVLNELAWVLATCPDAAFRNGAEALPLAARAAELTHRENSAVLLTLAAAQAEAGRFSDAVDNARLAQSLARTANQKSLADRAERMLKMFEQRLPCRE